MSDSGYDVQIGYTNNHWVLGADTSRGLIRVFFTAEGVRTGFKVIHWGGDITKLFKKDLRRALIVMRPRIRIGQWSV
jgi:hypothetical protein